jgi:hypothetical protein
LLEGFSELLRIHHFSSFPLLRPSRNSSFAA